MTRAFWLYAVIALGAFVALNVLVAHLQSDCGLRGLLGTSGCADDISRYGFPLRFGEHGGIGYHQTFDMPAFIADILIGLGTATLAGIAGRRRAMRAR